MRQPEQGAYQKVEIVKLDCPKAGFLLALFPCLLDSLNASPALKARSSAGEHFPDTEGVGGSIPPVPTNLSKYDGNVTGPAADFARR